MHGLHSLTHLLLQEVKGNGTKHAENQSSHTNIHTYDQWAIILTLQLHVAIATHTHTHPHKRHTVTAGNQSKDIRQESMAPLLHSGAPLC